MLYFACIVCPLVAMLSGITVAVAVVKFVVEVKRDIRSHNT